jgi:adenine deaminase
MLDPHLMRVALGERPADLAIVNGKIVNVYTREIYPGGVAVAGERIAAVGDVAYAIGERTTVIDAGGRCLVPGFVDAHTHPEDTHLSPARYAEAVLVRGTTSVMTDYHEIGVVGGPTAIEAALDEAAQTPLKVYFVVPSHIPFNPEVETSGGVMDSSHVETALRRPDAVGLSEVIGKLVVEQYPDLLRSIAATHCARRTLHGHGPPDMRGPRLNAYVSAGIASEHQTLTADSAVERLRAGLNVMMREGTLAKNLGPCSKAATEYGLATRNLSVVTDDLDVVDLVTVGHMDHVVLRALEEGLDFLTAIQMVTLNAVASYRLDLEIGGLAPGRYADINLTTDGSDFRVEATVARGRVVAWNGRLVAPLPLPRHPESFLRTLRLPRPLCADDMALPVPGAARRVRVRAVKVLEHIRLTSAVEADLPVEGGRIQADTARDILPVCVIERHGVTGGVGRGFVTGYGLRGGAIASTIAHDNHNIVVIGTAYADMAAAANHLARLQGGLCIVRDGRVIGDLALPILGLLTDEDAHTVAATEQRLNELAHALGCPLRRPFMLMSFLTLAGIPEWAITDKGLVSVEGARVVDAVVSVD